VDSYAHCPSKSHRSINWTHQAGSDALAFLFNPVITGDGLTSLNSHNSGMQKTPSCHVADEQTEARDALRLCYSARGLCVCRPASHRPQGYTYASQALLRWQNWIPATRFSGETCPPDKSHLLG
jgi:hypothetical protein